MANPLGAILAGLGGGASALGESMDQKALLAAQMKRQSAMDAIARMQKLQEMGLSQVPDDTTPTSDANLNPIQQLAAHAQSPQDVIAAGQQMKPTDYAVSQLVKLPNASGNMDTFTQGVPLAEQRDAARQEAEFERQQKLAAQAAAAKAVTPETMRKALDGDQDAVAEVLTKHPELATTLAKTTPPLQKLGAGEAVPDGKGGWTVPVPKTPEAMTDYQQQELALRKRALDMAEKKGAGLSDKDAQQMQMAQAMAQPAIDQLKGYFAKQENPGFVARAGSHIPLVGNSIVGMADQDYQKANQSAEVLATQYVETLPKGRASPQLIEQMKKQIAPELGDTPATRAQKLNTILTFERAIAKRAGGAQPATNPFADLIPNPQ